MSDIFLSYSSKDLERAKQLAEALTRQGWSVWWDRSILPGKIFDRVIEAELAATHCVIVLWSNDSVESSWVRAEAEVAMKKGHLIPALLGEVNIPLVFRQYQAASLVDWDGRETHPGFQQLLNAISSLLPRRTPSPATAPLSAANTAQHASTSNAIDNGTKAGDLSTAKTDPGAGKRLHRYFNVGAWVLVLVLAGTLAYINLLPKDHSGPAELSRAPAESPPLSQPLDVSAHKGELEPSAPLDPTTTAKKAEPDHQPSVEPPKTQQASPVLRSSKPNTSKPAAVVSNTTPEVVTNQQPAPRQTVAITAPAEAVAPLSVLTVTWAMPSDKGVASSARVQDYSAKVSKSMVAILQEILGKPVNFDYFYPTQQEYYRLLKDKDGNSESQALCKTKKTDLVVSAFISGAKFVSASYGYELTREPVFSVYDCNAAKKITNSYQISESHQDSFPYETSFRKVFRIFIEQNSHFNND